MNHSILNFNEKQKTAWLESIDALCRIFWGPNMDLCKLIAREDFFHPFADLDSVPAYDTSNALKQIKLLIGKHSDYRFLCEALEEEYVRLFISDRAGIIAPLYESCYEFENAPLLGPPATRMKNRLKANGLALQEHLNEPPDHLCIELEYLYFVIRKGWDENNDDFIKEGSSFAAEIMWPWVDRFHKKIAAQTPNSFYCLSASILKALIHVCYSPESRHPKYP